MVVMPIRTLGDPVLREPAHDVLTFDASLRKLADDMLEAMYDAPGIGLAAPQVGLSLRFFVFDLGDGSGPGTMANPVLTLLDGQQVEEEGCLSIPGLNWTTPRAMRARAEGLSLEGAPLTLEGDGLMARLLQHETDHLNATLFIDRLSEEERRAALAELRNQELRGHHARAERSRRGAR